MRKISSAKRKPKDTTTQAERLSAIAKHQRQANQPAPSLDLTPRMKAFDLEVEAISERVKQLASEWKFNVESICAEILRRSK